MPDPITISAGAAILAYVSKDGLSKLLGPTADYLGGELKDFVEKSQQNIGSIFQKAETKAGIKLSEPGTVNPRVLKHIIDEGRFTENELFAEYFGGMLASARTSDGIDDRGVYYSQIVKNMSTYQLRTHYFIYYIIWSKAKGKQIDLKSYDGRFSLDVIIPVSVYEDTFKVTDRAKEETIIAHSLSGLSRFELIEGTWAFGSTESLKREHLSVDSHSFFITPTITGLQLFLWAHGRGDDSVDSFLDPALVDNDALGVINSEKARFKSEDEVQASRRGFYVGN